MAFNGNEGTYITLTQGSTWTGSYRSANPDGVKGHFFGKTKLAEMLNQTGCVGLRFYRAIDDVGAEQLVVVGVVSNQTDMTSGLILDKSVLCPPYCDSGSGLNGGGGQ